MRSIGEALDEVKVGLWRRLGPVTLVDVDDIVGAGAPGGNTRIVEALARDDRGLRAFVPVHDPALAAEAWAVPLGMKRAFVLRGTPGYGQPAVALEAVVAARAEGEFGRTVRLDCGTFHVAVAERSPLPIHPKFWAELGLAARDGRSHRAKELFPLSNFLRHDVLPSPPRRERRSDEPGARPHPRLPRAPCTRRPRGTIGDAWIRS